MAYLKYALHHEASTKTLDTKIEAVRKAALDGFLPLRLIDSSLASTRRFGAAWVNHLF